MLLSVLLEAVRSGTCQSMSQLGMDLLIKHVKHRKDCEQSCLNMWNGSGSG